MRMQNRRYDEAQEAKGRDALPRQFSAVVVFKPVPALNQQPNVLEQLPHLTVHGLATQTGSRKPNYTHGGHCLLASYMRTQNSWHQYTKSSTFFSTARPVLPIRTGSTSIATFSEQRRRIDGPTLASRKAMPYHDMYSSTVFVNTVLPRLRGRRGALDLSGSGCHESHLDSQQRVVR